MYSSALTTGDVQNIEKHRTFCDGKLLRVPGLNENMKPARMVTTTATVTHCGADITTMDDKWDGRAGFSTIRRFIWVMSGYTYEEGAAYEGGALTSRAG